MTGAGAPGAAGIIRCLQFDNRIDLTVCDAQDDVAGKFLNKSFFVNKKATDKNFVSYLLQQCMKRKVDVLFPLVTAELFHLSQHKKEFENNGIQIIVSDFESLTIANNKALLHQHLAKHKIPVSNFMVAHNLPTLKKAFSKLGYPQQPICIKPAEGNGSRGVRIIDNSADEFKLLFNEKPNALYMRYSDLMRILNHKKFPELLISEVLPGEEFTVDTLMKNGKPQLIIPRSRTKMNNGISVAGKITKQKEIISYTEQIATTLNLNGPIGLQMKRNKDGKFRILEINPRIQGTSVALMGAGINLPLMSVLQEMNVKFKIPKVKWGVSFIRYYNEVYH